MPTGLLKDIIDRVPNNTRLMGLDLGTKTIGLAVSDSGHSIATPLKTIIRRKFTLDMEEIVKVSKDYDIGGYVFGWPLNMDGTHGASCDRVRSFIDGMGGYAQALGMKKGTDLWIALFDERLSTDAVHNFLIDDVDMSRTKRQNVVDKLAAHLILQGALDFIGACQGKTRI